jgi:hypothetical protein
MNTTNFSFEESFIYSVMWYERGEYEKGEVGRVSRFATFEEAAAFAEEKQKDNNVERVLMGKRFQKRLTK